MPFMDTFFRLRNGTIFFLTLIGIDQILTSNRIRFLELKAKTPRSLEAMRKKSMVEYIRFENLVKYFL